MLHDKYAYVKTVNRDWALILRGLSKKIKGASILQLTPLVSLLIGWKAYLNLIPSPKRGQSQKALSEGFRINLIPRERNDFYLLPTRILTAEYWCQRVFTHCRFRLSQVVSCGLYCLITYYRRLAGPFRTTQACGPLPL